jgi:dolichyldiphosphatase
MRLYIAGQVLLPIPGMSFLPEDPDATVLSMMLYSYHLGYHAPHQIYWGLGIGIMLGTSLYFVAELLPSWYPKSLLGQLKKFAVTNPISTWCQIRDGWALWADGGRHSEWLHWKQGWTEQQRLLETGKTKKS